MPPFIATPVSILQIGGRLITIVDKKKPSELTEVCAEASAILKQVYSELPTYEPIIPVLLQHGATALPSHCKMTPGISCCYDR